MLLCNRNYIAMFGHDARVRDTIIVTFLSPILTYCLRTPSTVHQSRSTNCYNRTRQVCRDVQFPAVYQTAYILHTKCFTCASDLIPGRFRNPCGNLPSVQTGQFYAVEANRECFAALTYCLPFYTHKEKKDL